MAATRSALRARILGLMYHLHRSLAVLAAGFQLFLADRALAQDRAGELALDVTRELTVEIGPRASGGAEAAEGLRACARRFEAAGLAAHEHVFTAVPMPEISVGGNVFVLPGEARFLGNSGKNVWASIQGVTSETIVLSGHIDTDGPDVPGARDDGIACGHVIEAAAHARARAQAKGPPRRTLVFAIFEGEERGHFGSRAFVRDRVAPGEVVHALSLDVLGTSHLALNGVNPTVDRVHVALALEAARRAGVPLSVPIPHLLFSRVIPQGERSDHRSWAFAGVPALHLLARGEEGFDPCYHTPRDAFERLEPEEVAKAARFLDEWVELAGNAPIEKTGDARFVPLAVPDPLGFAESACVLLVPGRVAHVLVVLLLVVALLSLIAGARKAERSAIGSLGISLGAGALAGAAFVLPFAAAAAATGVPAWHASFGRYVAAGSAWVLAVALAVSSRPIGQRASGGAACALGVLAFGAVSGALARAGTLELALLPALSALALAALPVTTKRGARAAAALLAVPGLVLLVRAGLYRDGSLTGTLPELGAAWLGAAVVLGAAFFPAALAVARALLPVSPGRRGAVAGLFGAVAVSAVAHSAPPYTDGAPETARVARRVFEGRGDEVVLAGHRPAADLARRFHFELEGKPLAVAAAGTATFASAAIAPVSSPGKVHFAFAPLEGSRRRIRVSVEPAPGLSIDRLAVVYTTPRPAKVSTAGEPFALAAGASFEAQVFGGRNGAIDERAFDFDDPSSGVSVHVEAYLVGDPLRVSAEGPLTFRTWSALIVDRKIK